MSPTVNILIETLAPAALVVGAAYAVLPWISSRNELARATAVAAMIAFMWRYMLWRWTSTLPPFAWSLDCIVGLMFVMVETLAVIGSTLSLITLARLKSRSAEADRNAVWLAQQPRPPLVDVFICTYNEDETILERTIVGALALDYEAKRVWVLDDSRRAWLRQLSERLGARYLTRSDNEGAKAGNINNGLLHVAGLPDPPDFVAILDADFVPLPNFLRRTLPLFRDGDVGIVQTPQHFINPDPFQSNLATAQVWPDEQRYFFDVVMASKDAWGAAFCCGTSSVIRFAALWKLGGVPSSSVTEDYLLTLRMNTFGYRTVYLNERLSLGLAPEGLKEYVTQRSRWALGLGQIWRGPLGPLRLGNKLRLIDRISLVDALLYWYASFAFRLLGIYVPILYWLFDVRAVRADVLTTLSYYLPYFAAHLAITGWLAQGRVIPLLSDVTQLLIATQVLKATTMGLLRPRGQKFQVTAKGGDRSKRLVQWPLVNTFLLYLVLTVAGVVWAFFVEDATKLRDSSALCLFWSWYNILILAIACVVCIEQPRYRAAERLKSSERAELRIGDTLANFPVRDLSLTGMRLAGVAPASTGTEVVVTIGGVCATGEIARIGRDEFAVQFKRDEAARSGIIRHIYSGRYSAQVGRIQPARVAAAILNRMIR
jgi:cellulose synthase/poly-beta-1,6-N-acetylglucosamine synthase-like glycosyltransferase